MFFAIGNFADFFILNLCNPVSNYRIFYFLCVPSIAIFIVFHFLRLASGVQFKISGFRHSF